MQCNQVQCNNSAGWVLWPLPMQTQTLSHCQRLADCCVSFQKVFWNTYKCRVRFFLQCVWEWLFMVIMMIITTMAYDHLLIIVWSISMIPMIPMILMIIVILVILTILMIPVILVIIRMETRWATTAIYWADFPQLRWFRWSEGPWREGVIVQV